jgi:DNA-binding PadR family transcriptional regulator
MGDRITELEGAVLGVVWSLGPITAYGVLQRFSASTTRGWSASTGAIYPAIKRLTREGLLESTPELQDRRSTRLLAITEAGKSALRDWIMGLEHWMGGAPVDPVRTRMNYIGILSRGQQLALVENARSNARRALNEIASFVPDPGHHREGVAIAARGVRADIEARIAWLGEVEKLLSRNGQGRTRKKRSA